MFGWLFRPSCPCDREAKRWVESRLAWLNDEFPRNVFEGRPIVVPTKHFFPEPIEPNRRSVSRLVARVASWMGVDMKRIRLEFDKLHSDVPLVNERGQALPDAAGLYEFDDERRTIVLSEAEFHHPEALLGTIAHELAHERLLGEGRLYGDEFDNELVTDLTVVHLGLGVMLANSPRNWASQQTTWPGSDLNRPEYMSPPMFGYALAHIAWFANDRKPTWRAHLGPAVRADFDQALRYLFATADSSFRPTSLDDEPDETI